MRRAALALLLAGCASIPGARPMTPAEDHAVSIAVGAWTDSRALETCDPLGGLEVAIADDAAYLGACHRCAVGALACPATAERYGRGSSCLASHYTGPMATSPVIVVSSRVEAGEVAAHIAHETLHLVRGCAVMAASGTDAYLPRYRAGVAPEDHARVQTAQDPAHVDRGLWARWGSGTVEGVAQARLRGAR